jgi:hypothetical protein
MARPATGLKLLADSRDQMKGYICGAAAGLAMLYGTLAPGEGFHVDDIMKDFPLMVRDMMREDIWLCSQSFCHDVGILESATEAYLDIRELDRFREERHVYFIHNHLSKDSPPTAADYRTLARLQYYSKGWDLNITALVFDSNGCWEYSLTEEMAEYLLKDERNVSLMNEAIRVLGSSAHPDMRSVRLQKAR